MLDLPPEMILYDTEYTSWEGAKARDWSGPNEYREIVNIGAVRIKTEDLTELDSFNIFIRPVKNPILSDYFIQLTNISQEEVDRLGVALEEAVQKFFTWCNNIPMYCYGIDDKIIKANCELIGVNFPFSSENCRDIRKVFGAAGIDTEKYKSSTIVRAFGGEPSRPAHTGLDDSRAIVDGLKLLKSSMSIYRHTV